MNRRLGCKYESPNEKDLFKSHKIGWYKSISSRFRGTAVLALPDCRQVISILVHCGRHIIYNNTINTTGKIDWKFDFETGSEAVKYGSC